LGTSVRTFSRAHPSADASYALVLDRLDGAITRIEELAKAQEGGYASKHSSVVRRQDLRRRLRQGLLRHLVTSAEDAGVDNPGVAEKFRLPPAAATHAAFRAMAANLLEEGRANQEVLVRQGLSATLLDELENGIKEFDASLQDSDGSKQTHVAARAEMKALGDEIVRIVGILDGFNRYRFHHDPELIAAWESAKHRVSGPTPKEESAPSPTVPVPSGLEPAA
jgi:hypothetical protein